MDRRGKTQHCGILFFHTDLQEYIMKEAASQFHSYIFRFLCSLLFAGTTKFIFLQILDYALGLICIICNKIRGICLVSKNFVISISLSCSKKPLILRCYFFVYVSFLCIANVSLAQTTF